MRAAWYVARGREQSRPGTRSAAPAGVIPECVEQLPDTRRGILRLIKMRGPSTTAEIAEAFGITHEGARKHVLELLREKWVTGDCSTDADDDVQRPGRPAVRYCLTPAGDHFFAKSYDDLVAVFLGFASDDGTLRELLTRITDARVERLLPRVEGKSLARRVGVLGSVYLPDDEYMEIARDGADHLLIERNCPFLNVALREPAICSTTVSTLRRLTGHRVVRERRFQDGDGRCVFRILADSPEPDDVSFEVEPDPPQLPNS